MRILVLGEDGLIGSAVLAHLLDAGHAVLALGRDTGSAQRRFPKATWIARDIASLREPAAWKPLIAGCDAVVNCAGVLQDGPRDDVRAVQDIAMQALFLACAEAEIHRVVQVSAIGAAPDARTAFMRTKHAATAAVAQPLTGLALAHLVGWPLGEGWILASIALYGVVGLFWLPVLAIRLRMRDLARAAAAQGRPLPPAYDRLFRTWFACGWPAFGAMLATLWLMTAKPIGG